MIIFFDFADAQLPKCKVFYALKVGNEPFSNFLDEFIILITRHSF